MYKLRNIDHISITRFSLFTREVVVSNYSSYMVRIGPLRGLGIM